MCALMILSSLTPFYLTHVFLSFCSHLVSATLTRDTLINTLKKHTFITSFFIPKFVRAKAQFRLGEKKDDAIINIIRGVTKWCAS